MCGFAFSFLTANQFVNSNDAATLQRSLKKDLSGLLRRGPDHFACTTIKLPSSNNYIFACNCVLGQRGSHTTQQPLVFKSSEKALCYYLFWNGEIFSSSNVSLSTVYRTASVNDAETLLSHLANHSLDEAVEIMSSLRGPISFILFESSSGRVLYGRDRFGRRSLVGERTQSSVAEVGFNLSTISSIYLPSEPGQAAIGDLKALPIWIEIPACGIFEGRVIDSSECSIATTKLYPWTAEHAAMWGSCSLHVPTVTEPLLPLPGTLTVDAITLTSNITQTFLDLLAAAVCDRVLLASPTCRVCSTLESESPIPRTCGHARYAVLFSGGLDSTVLAYLCHRYVPAEEPIDLINVSFEQELPINASKNERIADQQRSVRGATRVISVDEAPDRQTALASYIELVQLSPDRIWQLVKVDVTVEELRAVRKRHVNDLLIPGACTVLDDSLGLAFWFAARGSGHLHHLPQRGSTESATETKPESTGQMYTSPAKVVFVGSGVDEQLAGYSRHRVKYEQFGEKALAEELRMEMSRISERNLGRDDRMISDHGREARLPYLDERLTDFLAALPVHLKADLRLPRGVGDKLLLRDAARLLGLRVAAGHMKRAMQFGSRVAKAEAFVNRKLSGPADKLTLSNRQPALS